MKQVNEMPTEGQFVAMWEYNNKIWSDTFRWVDGSLKISSKDGEDWYEHQLYPGDICENAIFYIKSEDFEFTTNDLDTEEHF